jgi:hypothetical protein
VAAGLRLPVQYCRTGKPLVALMERCWMNVASASVDADTSVGGTAADAGSQVADASFQHVDADADSIANGRARHAKRSQTPAFAADSAATGPASFRNSSSSSSSSSGSNRSLNAGDATFHTSATEGATPTEQLRSGQRQQRRPTIEEVVVELEQLFTQTQHDANVSSAVGWRQRKSTLSPLIQALWITRALARRTTGVVAAAAATAAAVAAVAAGWGARGPGRLPPCSLRANTSLCVL